MGAFCSTDKDDPEPLPPVKGQHGKLSKSNATTSRHPLTRSKSAPTMATVWYSQAKTRLDSLVGSDSVATANQRLRNALNNDDALIFEPHPPAQGWQGQLHPRWAGDHFLYNQPLIDGAAPDASKSQLLQIMDKMPKGAHLHIHFNSTLPPEFLLREAAQQPHMRIWSTLPLTSCENLDLCEIQFSILKHDEPGLSAFKHGYSAIKYDGEPTDAAEAQDRKRDDARQKMMYSDFRSQWTRIHQSYTKDLPAGADDEKRWASVKDLLTYREWQQVRPRIEPLGFEEWLVTKLVFDGDEVYNPHQDQCGAWAKFNGRTRMMKGLFNYETAYRKYTRECLEKFQSENVQYAEIRPNFMQTNQIWKDDGSKSLKNEDTLDIIVEEYQRFMTDIEDMKGGKLVENRLPNKEDQPSAEMNRFENTSQAQSNGQRRGFNGLKVIYCTPRSFSRVMVQLALDECSRFKDKWPAYIAGFDLVGEESQGHELNYFRDEFVGFQKTRTHSNKAHLPFLFHCGETQGDSDGNLGEVVQLIEAIGSGASPVKRLGHLYAAPQHPTVMKRLKDEDICAEVCLTSNEILRLCERARDHPLYDLLDYGFPCTLNSDNGTPFRTSLAHEFYQAVIGMRDTPRMIDLYGCRQLAQWSLDYSCMDRDEREQAQVEFDLRWAEFIDWVNNHDDFAVKIATEADKAKAQKAKSRAEAEDRDRKKFPGL